MIDPFSDQCAVITGSHNFSDSASQKNDENLVIVRGNKKLTQAYALHINGVYDHYSWRAFLGSGGDPDQIFKPLDGWMPGGSRAQELDFWMNQPIPPQRTKQGTSSAKSKAGKTPKKSKTSPKKKAAPKKSSKTSPKKSKAGRKKKATPASRAKAARKSKKTGRAAPKEAKRKPARGR